jgi:uncharacterized protein (TIGR02147 family)
MSGYRVALREALARRVGANPRYSLRAFARDLGISPSYLSQVLSRARGLSPRNSGPVLERLGLSERERAIYQLEIRRDAFRNEQGRRKLQRQLDLVLEEARSITLANDAFAVISDWYPMVMLQLLVLDGAPRDSRARFAAFSARRLGIPRASARQALASLIRLGLVRENAGRLERVHDTVWAGGDVPSRAIRQFHRQMLQKAAAAMELQSLDERSFHALQIPMRRSDLVELEAMLVRFRKQVLAKFGRMDGSADALVAVQLQRFSLVSERRPASRKKARAR